MAWTYDPTLAEDKDIVRFLVGDTDTAAQLVPDEAIEWQIEQEANVHVAASRVASAIAAHFAREVDKGSDGDRISSSQRFKQYKELAESLLEEAQRSGAVNAAGPYVGGISYSDKQAYESDDDRIPTAIRIGIHSRRQRDHDWTERQVDV